MVVKLGHKLMILQLATIDLVLLILRVDMEELIDNDFIITAVLLVMHNDEHYLSHQVHIKVH
jgi:hypothetical protein